MNTENVHRIVPQPLLDEDQLAIDRAKIEFPELFERSIPFNIPAKIIMESTPSSYASARMFERAWLGGLPASSEDSTDAE